MLPLEEPALVWARGTDPDDPDNITTVTGPQEIVGNGILVLDGALSLSGADCKLDWTGIVIVRNALIIDDFASFKVNGGVVLHGSPDYTQTRVDEGTFHVSYSREALAMAEYGGLSKIPGGVVWELFHWREAPIPHSGASP